MTFRSLAHASLAPSGCYVRDVFNPPRVEPGSPATQAMTDLSKVAPASINSEASLAEANQSMIQRGVRLLLVVDGAHRIQGVLSSADVLGERPTQIATRQRMRHADLRVQDVMTPTDQVEVLHMDEVSRAAVGNVVSTLRDSGRAHALVVQTGADGRQTLVGIFSASQIARQLGIRLDTHEMARTFAEIEALIAGSAPGAVA
ncbi:MAG: CBS domain-containing protein [Pseudomonadota bacterium]|nr:CBS domain-containing protein [Pseudomonadota bacterium]